LFTAASVLLAIEHTNTGSPPDVASQAAFDRSLEILQQMRGHSSMAATYATMLERARQARTMAQEVTVPQAAATNQLDTSLGDNNSGPNTNAFNLSEYLATSPQLGPSTFSWNAQDHFHEPWDFLLEDNFMPWN
jgi:hypothetical protein